MGITRADVDRVIRQRWGDGNSFQTREVREKLGIVGADKNEVSRVHNFVKAIEREGAIERLPGDQKRNQRFRLKVATLVAAGTPTGRTGSGAPKPQTAADRLGRMEDALSALQQALTSIEAKVDRALAILAIWQ